MEELTKTADATSANRLLSVVMKHGVRLAQVIGPATIQPHHWPAVHLAMLGAIDDAALLAPPATERLQLAFIADFLQRNCEDRRLVSAPIADQVMDLIAWQQDQIEALRTTTDKQQARIEALRDVIRVQDEEIARCSTKPLPYTPISVSTVSYAPAVPITSLAADPMPQPESMPAMTADQDTATSVSPASGSQRTAGRAASGRRYTAEQKTALRAEIVRRIQGMLERGEKVSMPRFEKENADLPNGSSFTKTLAVDWLDLVAQAKTMARTANMEMHAKETTAAIPAAVPFSGANGAGE